MSETEEECEPTILDRLPVELMFKILNYLPLRDVLASERVSKQWQELVHYYLKGVHIGFEDSDFSIREAYPNKCQWLTCPGDWSSFEHWLKKPGFAVKAIYSHSDETLNIIGRLCPNLEALVLFYFLDEELPEMEDAPYKRLQQLRYLCFSDGDVSDDSVSRLIGNNVLQTLEIHNNCNVTGEFLTAINLENLQCLVINYCSAFEFDLLSIRPVFTKLTKLVLNCASLPTYSNIIEALRALTNLEHLELKGYLHLNGDTSEFFSCVAELPRLRVATLEAAARGADLRRLLRAPRLARLHLRAATGVSGESAVDALGARGGALVSLALRRAALDDRHVAAVVAACPRLEFLDVSGCEALTPGFAAAAAAARARAGAGGPLRVRARPPRAGEGARRDPAAWQDLECPPELVLDVGAGAGSPRAGSVLGWGEEPLWPPEHTSRRRLLWLRLKRRLRHFFSLRRFRNRWRHWRT